MNITAPSHWDIFCQVIDNFGDVGVCWRLAADLGARGHNVRLWIDDASSLRWMAPGGAPNVEVLDWNAPLPADGPGDVVIEAFGCEPPGPFVAAIGAAHNAGDKKVTWINLEYLSAESYVERCHALPSLIMSGPAAGVTRWFFYPGFTDKTGGLLRELTLSDRQQDFDRSVWRAEHGIQSADLAISLFCYEPAALPALVKQSLAQSALPIFVTPGRATAAVTSTLEATQTNTPRQIQFLEPRPQAGFDEMLWACDLNFVRGEDSLVRALWAGEAFVWQIYPQDDNAHHAKLEAFLDWLDAPATLRQAHAVWNGLVSADQFPAISKDLVAEWRACTRSARARLLLESDLLTQLLSFVAEKS